MEFRLLPNQSEKGNYNLNLVEEISLHENLSNLRNRNCNLASLYYEIRIAAWIKNAFRRTSQDNYSYNNLNLSFQ